MKWTEIEKRIKLSVLIKITMKRVAGSLCNDSSLEYVWVGVEKYFVGPLPKKMILFIYTTR